MTSLPINDHPVIVRTDFSDETTWVSIKQLIQNPAEPFICNLSFLDDAGFSEVNIDDLLSTLPDPYPHTFIVLADTITMAAPDHPLLVIDLMEGIGKTFRAIPSEIPAIENNLSIGNMAFSDYATAVNQDGVFRGFPSIHE